jgi:UDP-galactopyranose mutase
MKISIVGAGLAGATAAAILSPKHKVTVFEQRRHIGGNCYDGYINNILVHQYGAHIFHTSDKSAWDFVNKYAKFREYKHSVKAHTDRGDFDLPLNKCVVDKYDFSNADIINLVYRYYSEKQWGISWEGLPDSIKNRVPTINYTNDSRYFSDTYEGLPVDGYTKMIDVMLEGSKIVFTELVHEWQEYPYDIVIYTGMVDQLFDYSMGNLQYRSLSHSHVQRPRREYAVLNECTKQVPYLRSYDNYYWNFSRSYEESIITYEYPAEFIAGYNVPFYPLHTEHSTELYKAYTQILPDNMILVGRLGLYSYLDMDKTILTTMNKVSTI